MAQTLMFAYVLIIFLFSFRSMTFLTQFTIFFFLIYLVYNMSSHFSKKSFLFDNVGKFSCRTIFDCPALVYHIYDSCLDGVCWYEERFEYEWCRRMFFLCFYCASVCVLFFFFANIRCVHNRKQPPPPSSSYDVFLKYF